MERELDSAKNSLRISQQENQTLQNENNDLKNKIK